MEIQLRENNKKAGRAVKRTVPRGGGEGKQEHGGVREEEALKPKCH